MSEGEPPAAASPARTSASPDGTWRMGRPAAAELPPVVRVGAAEGRDTGLAATVDLLSAEVDRTDPGSGAVVGTLVDLLIVYLLRAWLAAPATPDGSAGWLRALRDPAVGRALALVHAEPGRPWTVASLARAAGTSRATFGRRFTALTGHSPMAYVTGWRMAVAARLLRDGREPLRDVARRVGYDSEFAFARAFKRAAGEAPGRYRHAHTGGGRGRPELAWRSWGSI